MLRYFYILCFLVYIDWSFCYEFTANKGLEQSGLSIKSARLKHQKQKVAGPRIRRHEEGKNRDNVAQIDLANFMQPDPELQPFDEGLVYDDIKGYGGLGSLNNYQMNPEGHDFKDTDNLDNAFGMYNTKSKSDTTESDNMDASMEPPKVIHKSKKKSSEKRSKFPFFSRKDNGSKKLKKDKKRKFFNFYSNKNDETASTSPPTESNLELKGFNNRIQKRSKFCPICKRQILQKKVNKEKNAPTIIHNSRQYFQGSKKQKKEIVNGLLGSGGASEKHRHNERRKRDEQYNNRLRQLKELDEVQRKIDEVHITMPNFMSSTPDPLQQAT